MGANMKNATVLMVDNYDSFTYNLVHYFKKLGCRLLVRRNDELDLKQVRRIQPTHLVISPGPGNPDQAGICLSLVESLQEQIPILGVCLGHQVIGQVFGARVVAAPQVMHGKISAIYHNGQGIFHDLPQGFSATRYHSLVLDPDSIPDCLQVTAWTQDAQGQRECIMGVRHRYLPIEGVQFHPESVLSEQGLALLNTFLQRHG